MRVVSHSAVNEYIGWQLATATATVVDLFHLAASAVDVI